jgi:sarcosine oxidase
MFTPERFPGFTREVDGVVVYGIPSLWSGTARVGFAGPRSRFADPDDLDRITVPPSEIARIQTIVTEILPDMVPSVIRTGTHLDSYTPDGQPLIGALDADDRVLTAAAFNGRGFKMAPVIGRILADLAVGARTGTDISRWNPARFRV